MNIKIKFTTNPNEMKTNNVLFWDNYEEKVRAGIKAGKGGSYVVLMKYIMPRSEMDNIIIELCGRIARDGYPPISFGSIAKRYTYSGEPNCDNLVSEATYHFEV